MTLPRVYCPNCNEPMLPRALERQETAWRTVREEHWARDGTRQGTTTTEKPYLKTIREVVCSHCQRKLPDLGAATREEFVGRKKGRRLYLAVSVPAGLGGALAGFLGAGLLARNVVVGVVVGVVAAYLAIVAVRARFKSAGICVPPPMSPVQWLVSIVAVAVAGAIPLAILVTLTASFFTHSDTPPMPPSVTVRQASKQVSFAQGCKLRAEPRAGSEQVGWAEPTKQYEVAETQSGWDRLMLPSGKTGWAGCRTATATK